MFELTGRSYALPYRNRRASRPVVLAGGTIVEAASPEERAHAPNEFRTFLEVDEASGKPLPLRHDRDLDDDFHSYFVGLVGIFLIPNGQVAAVYGPAVEEISVPPAST